MREIKVRKVLVDSNDPDVVGQSLVDYFFVDDWRLAEHVDRLECKSNRWRCVASDFNNEEIRLQYSVFDPLTLYFVFENDDVLSCESGIWAWDDLSDFDDDFFLCLDDDVVVEDDEDDDLEGGDAVEGEYYSMLDDNEV